MSESIKSTSMAQATFDGYFDVEKALFRGDISSKESQKLYTSWASDGDYDKLLADNPNGYASLTNMSRAMLQLFPEARGERMVLDVGAGTGLSGLALLQLDFKAIDALEPNGAFADKAEDKKIYRQIFRQFIGGGAPMPAPENTYDAITITGAFAPGHIPCDSIPDCIRMLKPGGYLVNCMREEFLWTCPEYKDRLEPLLLKLVQEGKWKMVRKENYPNHYIGKDGFMMIYQKC